MPLAVGVLLLLLALPVQAQTVTVDPFTDYVAGATGTQTIHGFCAALDLGWFEEPGGGTVYDDRALYVDALLKDAVNVLGLSCGILAIRTGFENTPGDDVFDGFMTDDGTTKNDWNIWRENPVDDNADPNDAAAGAFYFSEIDIKSQVFQPLRVAMSARGEDFSVIGQLIDTADATLYQAEPDEYGELLSELYQYMDTTYGFSPDAQEITLEPNLQDWTDTELSNAVGTANTRLSTDGFDPLWWGPSHSSAASVASTIDAWQAATFPTALDAIATHRYGSSTALTDGSLKDEAVTESLDGVMQTEHNEATPTEMHEDLADGEVSAFLQGSLAFPNTGSGFHLINIDDGTPGAPTWEHQPQADYFSHYFDFIRPGAVRVTASSSDGDWKPVAFRNRSGHVVVVIQAVTSGTVIVNGLVGGRYAATYTYGTTETATPTGIRVDGGTTDVLDGSSISVTVPSAGGSTFAQISIKKVVTPCLRCRIP